MVEASADLLARVGAGDEAAAAEVFHRFVERLVGLTAGHLSAKLAQRLDPEDVVQSAYRSFFRGARQGRFSLEKSGDLWRLLVSITLNKLRSQAERHKAGKRGLDQECRAAADPLNLIAGREPTPLEAAALADEVERLLSGMPPHQRPILEMRLQGYNLDEIAQEMKCTERTVRRALDGVKTLLEEAK